MLIINLEKQIMDYLDGINKDHRKDNLVWIRMKNINTIVNFWVDESLGFRDYLCDGITNLEEYNEYVDNKIENVVFGISGLLADPNIVNGIEIEYISSEEVEKIMRYKDNIK